MGDLIYVETSIPSFYWDSRLSLEMRVRRSWTRRWWDDHRHEHQLVTSVAVYAELDEAPSPKRERALDLIRELTRLEFAPEIDSLVTHYITNKVMPKEALGDAAHLAFASFHRCDWLLTWNCKHLANANKFGHIRVVNDRLGLKTPDIVTPLELIGDDNEEAEV